MGGYHKREIVAEGTLGELSKIVEELDELREAEEQSNKILMLCELADLYGAINLYLESKFPGFTMEDLAKMEACTREAFEQGFRKAKNERVTKQSNPPDHIQNKGS